MPSPAKRRRRNFPSQCDRILKAFDCHELIDGSSLLSADSSIACDANYKGTVVLAAIAFLVVYAGGVPLLFLRRLKRFDTVRHMKQPMKQLGFLYVPRLARTRPSTSFAARSSSLCSFA